MDASQIQDLVIGSFTYLPAYNVLIYRQYRYGIQFGQIRYYLDSKHILRPEIRTEITKYILNTYSGSFRLPTEKIERINELPVYKKFIYRSGCSYLYESRDNMVKYLKRDHEWIPEKKGGYRGKKSARTP